MSKPETLDKKWATKIPPQALDLLKQLLAIEPSQRPSCLACLQHPFLAPVAGDISNLGFSSTPPVPRLSQSGVAAASSSMASPRPGEEQPAPVDRGSKIRQRRQTGASDGDEDDDLSAMNAAQNAPSPSPAAVNQSSPMVRISTKSNNDDDAGSDQESMTWGSVKKKPAVNAARPASLRGGGRRDIGEMMQQAQQAQFQQLQSYPSLEEKVERSPSDTSQQLGGYPSSSTSNRLSTPLGGGGGGKGSREGTGHLAAGVSALKVSGSRGGESPDRFSAASSRNSHNQGFTNTSSPQHMMPGGTQRAVGGGGLRGNVSPGNSSVMEGYHTPPMSINARGGGVAAAQGSPHYGSNPRAGGGGGGHLPTTHHRGGGGGGGGNSRPTTQQSLFPGATGGFSQQGMPPLPPGWRNGSPGSDADYYGHGGGKYGGVSSRVGGEERPNTKQGGSRNQAPPISLPRHNARY